MTEQTHQQAELGIQSFFCLQDMADVITGSLENIDDDEGVKPLDDILYYMNHVSFEDHAYKYREDMHIIMTKAITLKELYDEIL